MDTLTEPGNQIESTLVAEFEELLSRLRNENMSLSSYPTNGTVEVEAGLEVVNSNTSEARMFQSNGEFTYNGQRWTLLIPRQPTDEELHGRIVSVHRSDPDGSSGAVYEFTDHSIRFPSNNEIEENHGA